MIKPLAQSLSLKSQYTRAHLGICFWGLYIQHGQFTGIELGLWLVDLGSIHARIFVFNYIKTLNELWTFTCTLAYQAIHLFGVTTVNLYHQFYAGNIALCIIRSGGVDG